MADSVAVTLEVEPDAAAALADARTRMAIGRVVSQVLAPRSDPAELARVIAEARAAGRSGAKLTNERADQVVAGRALAQEFRGFRCGRTLGGLEPRALIR
jgi:hypothetical protein